MNAAILFSVLLLIAGASATPDQIALFYKGYFKQFQTNLMDPRGCYLTTQDVYSDVSLLVEKLMTFEMYDLPVVVFSLTSTVQVFLNQDMACKTKQTFAELWNVLSHPELLLSRLDFLSLFKIMGNIQSGILNSDYQVLGDGVGLLAFKALGFKV